MRITADTYPRIHAAIDLACDTVNLPARPEFYVECGYEVGGSTCGEDHPIIILTSGAIDYLDDRELSFVIGHEVGHIKSRHILYGQIAAEIAVFMVNLNAATLGLSGWITQSLMAALF